jgi:predicted transcriptional regulator
MGNIMNKQFEEYCIHESETILNAIERIHQNNMRTILVINNFEKVVGIVSQGDILRAIIMGTTLYGQVNKIMTTSFSYLRKKDFSQAVKLFISKYFSIIPVLTDDFKLKDIILFTDVIQNLISKKPQ